jgi:hypothetical protein
MRDAGSRDVDPLGYGSLMVRASKLTGNHPGLRSTVVVGLHWQRELEGLAGVSDLVEPRHRLFECASAVTSFPRISPRVNHTSEEIGARLRRQWQAKTG